MYIFKIDLNVLCYENLYILEIKFLYNLMNQIKYFLFKSFVVLIKSKIVFILYVRLLYELNMIFFGYLLK